MNLVKLASDLDEKGLHEEADQLDKIIKKAQDIPEEINVVKAHIEALTRVLYNEFIRLQTDPLSEHSKMILVIQDSLSDPEDIIKIKDFAWQRVTDMVTHKS